MAHRRLKGLLTGIWATNALICLVAGGLYAWYAAPEAAQADPSTPLPLPTPQATRTAKPPRTPLPPPTQRATITPWPTPSRGPSVTPMDVQPLNRMVIGRSVEDRPLEVYHYGRGPMRKLIVAGIHGGYEWNTIALADELIAYLNDHPERVPANTTL